MKYCLTHRVRQCLISQASPVTKPIQISPDLSSEFIQVVCSLLSRPVEAIGTMLVEALSARLASLAV